MPAGERIYATLAAWIAARDAAITAALDERRALLGYEQALLARAEAEHTASMAAPGTRDYLIGERHVLLQRRIVRALQKRLRDLDEALERDGASVAVKLHI